VAFNAFLGQFFLVPRLAVGMWLRKDISIAYLKWKLVFESRYSWSKSWDVAGVL
jgi:hypothetical protein